MEIRRHRAAIRATLIFLSVEIGLVAVWILIGPRGFYDNFPGGSHHWVSVLPPYNEHLERDFGAAGLGLALLAALAAIWMDRRVVQAAAITLTAAGLPHFIYHLTTTDRLSTEDNLGTLLGLGMEVALPLALLYLASDGVQGSAATASERVSPSR